LLNNLAITLLSDLGRRDASVTVAKAIIMRHVQDAVFVDISHNVVQYDLQQGAYILLSAYKHFPKGTIHVLLVDVFLGNVPRMVLAEKDGYYFIAPDNGILGLAFGGEQGQTRLCAEFMNGCSFKDWVNSVGEVVGSINAGGINSFEFCEAKSAKRLLQPQAMPLGIDCNILYIDRYENVVLDITRRQFEEYVKGRAFRIKVMRMQDITTISNNYNDVAEGEPLCRFNSAGFLEIALNHEPAASLLGLGSINQGSLRYQTIRIFFQG